MTKTISFDGHDFEYDPKEAVSYKNIKRMARAQKDPYAFFEVAEAIFCGKDEEYAEVLGNDISKLGELVGQVISNEGDTAKN